MFYDALVWILLILSAVVGGIAWLVWRKREQEHLPEPAKLEEEFEHDYFAPSAASRPATHKGEPHLDETLLDEVIEDEFWMPAAEPKVLGGNTENTGTPEDKDDERTHPHELIVPLYVRALNQSGFNGADIFAAMEQLELQYGDMRIFHHYGLEEHAAASAVPMSGKPVFSIANLVEPGTFEPEGAERFSSPGLILFMRLPGPLCGRVGFELMLNYAQRLAEILKGVLENERRETLTVENLAYLREGIAAFDEERG